MDIFPQPHWKLDTSNFYSLVVPRFYVGTRDTEVYVRLTLEGERMTHVDFLAKQLKPTVEGTYAQAKLLPLAINLRGEVETAAAQDANVRFSRGLLSGQGVTPEHIYSAGAPTGIAHLAQQDFLYFRHIACEYLGAKNIVSARPPIPDHLKPKVTLEQKVQKAESQRSTSIKVTTEITVEQKKPEPPAPAP